ncbi:MAG: hypothetical protein WC823_06720 [Parcubacteria group bacterium]
MNRVSENRVVLAIFFLMIMLFFPHFSQAEKAQLTVDRGMIDVPAQSGQDAEFSFSVRNDSSEKQVINLEERDITLGDDNVMSVVEAQGGPSNLVVFQENNFIMEPGATKKIIGVMQLTQEKKEAAFYNMLTLISFAGVATGEELMGPQVQGKIGVYTFIKVGENHNATGRIEEIGLAGFLRGDEEIRVVYANTGDVYFVPKTKVIIKNVFGGWEKEISLDQHFVFPGRQVTFVGKIAGNSPWGFFQVQTKFVDGMGGVQIATSYACGYLFPVGVILVLLGIILVTIFILRKRNQVAMEMLEKK